MVTIRDGLLRQMRNAAMYYWHYWQRAAVPDIELDDFGFVKESVM